MRPEGVRQGLLEQPEMPTEIRLNDGTRILVRTKEHWAISPEFLVAVDDRGHTHLVTYRNIADIVIARRNGHRPRRRA